jgi:hypothetical protein
LPPLQKSFCAIARALFGCNSRVSLPSANVTEIDGFVLTSVLTQPFFWVLSGEFTYEERRGRESNPRIAVLQTATLPLGYPANIQKRQTIPIWRLDVNARRRSENRLIIQRFSDLVV